MWNRSYDLNSEMQKIIIIARSPPLKSEGKLKMGSKTFLILRERTELKTPTSNSNNLTLPSTSHSINNMEMTQMQNNVKSSSSCCGSQKSKDSILKSQNADETGKRSKKRRLSSCISSEQEDPELSKKSSETISEKSSGKLISNSSESIIRDPKREKKKLKESKEKPKGRLTTKEKKNKEKAAESVKKSNSTVKANESTDKIKKKKEKKKSKDKEKSTVLTPNEEAARFELAQSGQIKKETLSESYTSLNNLEEKEKSTDDLAKLSQSSVMSDVSIRKEKSSKSKKKDKTSKKSKSRDKIKDTKSAITFESMEEPVVSESTIQDDASSKEDKHISKPSDVQKSSKISVKTSKSSSAVHKKGSKVSLDSQASTTTLSSKSSEETAVPLKTCCSSRCSDRQSGNFGGCRKPSRISCQNFKAKRQKSKLEICKPPKKPKPPKPPKAQKLKKRRKTSKPLIPEQFKKKLKDSYKKLQNNAVPFLEKNSKRTVKKIKVIYKNLNEMLSKKENDLKDCDSRHSGCSRANLKDCDSTDSGCNRTNLNISTTSMSTACVKELQSNMKSSTSKASTKTLTIVEPTRNEPDKISRSSSCCPSRKRTKVEKNNSTGSLKTIKSDTSVTKKPSKDSPKNKKFEKKDATEKKLKKAEDVPSKNLTSESFPDTTSKSTSETTPKSTTEITSKSSSKTSSNKALKTTPSSVKKKKKNSKKNLRHVNTDNIEKSEKDESYDTFQICECPSNPIKPSESNLYPQCHCSEGACEESAKKKKSAPSPCCIKSQSSNDQ